MHSIKDPLFKQIRALRTVQGRQEEKAFLIEGFDLLQKALMSNVQIEHVLVASKDVIEDEVASLLSQKNLAVKEIGAGFMHKLFPTGKRPDVVAVANIPVHPLSEYASARTVLLLESIQDPGNLGSIFRSAAAFGCGSIFCLMAQPEEIYNRIAIRASMGTIFDLMITPITYDMLFEFKKAHDFHLVVSTPYTKSKLKDMIPNKQKQIIVIGNETDGVSEQLITAADHLARIPMQSDVESLNVSAATAIFLYHYFTR